MTDFLRGCFSQIFASRFGNMLLSERRTSTGLLFRSLPDLLALELVLPFKRLVKTSGPQDIPSA